MMPTSHTSPPIGIDSSALTSIAPVCLRGLLMTAPSPKVLGQSETRAAHTLREDHQLAAALEAAIRAAWLPVRPSSPVAASAS